MPREAANNAPSLTRAFNLGHISTVPLIDVLNDGGDVQGPLLSTVKVAVGMFIFISTGVSFFVMSAGMKNFVDGGLHYMDETYGGGEKEVWFRKSVAYMGSFGAILWISVDDPSGFINILANTSSFALSFQAGLLLFLMLYNCRRSIGAGAGVGGIEGGEEENGSNVEKKERRLDTCDGCIPLEMSRSLSTVYIVYGVLFFLLACCMAAIAPFVGLTSQVEE